MKSLETSSLPFDPSRAPVYLRRLETELERRRERALLEGSLTEFVRAAWPSIDPAEYQESWAIDALCDHLEAVTEGHIKRLLVNYPPRCGKTNVTSICWPAWTWARQKQTYLSGPATKFLCGSYSYKLSNQNSNMTRRLIMSPWYQERWGKSFSIREDQNAKEQFDNTKGGSRIAASVRGGLLGIGGNIIDVDDPHNTEEVESEAERETVLTWWRELRSTRLNDPKQAAIVVIMQRLHAEDVSGFILDGPDADDWTHLMIPMSYDSRRHCVTVLKRDDDGESEKVWEDPRTEDGELMWPERFGPREVRALEVSLGSYMASGRLQQMPTPSGGGIFKRDWWQLYPPEGEAFTPAGKPVKPLEFPRMEYIVASVDTALTEKEENDWSACTVWGSWRNEYDRSKLMLMDAWQDRLEFRPLVERIIETCRRNRVDRVLIEAKANGISVAQEIGRLLRGEEFGGSMIVPKGDKVARAYAVTHLFEARMIYAPDRKWADMVMDQCAVFPKGAHDDLVDTVTQALKHLRDSGIASLPEEREDDLMRRNSVRASQPPALPYAV